MCVSSVVLFSERLGTGRRLPRTGIFHRLAESLSLHFEKKKIAAPMPMMLRQLPLDQNYSRISHRIVCDTKMQLTSKPQNMHHKMRYC